MDGKPVLVVEDNELNMKLVRAILNLNHFKVVEANTAEKGIQAAGKYKPMAILMDIQLPGMDGLTATRTLKSDPELCSIPIIALTSYAMDGDKQKALDAGCAGYITKPISTKTFISQFQKILVGKESIPMCMDDPREQGRRENERRPSNKPRILIVDDDPINVKVLTAKLAAEQYELYSASGGKECLRMVEEILPDLILLDIMMPEINGYEVTATLKTNPSTSHIPIVLVTALDNPDDRTKGMTSGADEFLTKPVNKTELLARVSSMLRLKKYHEQLSLRTQAEEKFVGGTQRASVAPPSGKLLPRVLAVEDNSLDLKLIQNFLLTQPYELITADSGETAIEMATTEKIDVILLDVVLPGMDGFEVCRRLKAEDKTRNIQIVMITGLSDLDSKIMGVEQGADDFLVKPINKREIQARIMALLRKKNYLDQICTHYEMALSSAIMDDLTGLYNRAYFINSLELEMKRSQRQKYAIALAMMDIDDFKLYNDQLGHLDGDMLLREISQVIRLSVREVDMAVRYGGEEFAIIMPYTNQDDAVKAANRVLDMIRKHPYSNGKIQKVKPVTMSAGIAVFPEDAQSVNELICRADEMLYKAKRGGKNQVCCRFLDIEQPHCQAF